jgi:hypothetical protein
VKVIFIPTLFALVLALPARLLAQSPTTYEPLLSTAAKGVSVQPTLKQMEQAHQKELANLPRQHREEFERTYKERYQSLAEELKGGEFIQDPRVNGYFEQIMAEIYRGNAALAHQPVRLLVSRSLVPNAYCVGEGTVVVWSTCRWCATYTTRARWPLCCATNWPIFTSTMST